jgi:hypothetical protein
VGGRALPIAANRTGGSFVLSRAQGGELCSAEASRLTLARAGCSQRG